MSTERVDRTMSRVPDSGWGVAPTGVGEGGEEGTRRAHRGCLDGELSVVGVTIPVRSARASTTIELLVDALAARKALERLTYLLEALGENPDEDLHFVSWLSVNALYMYSGRRILKLTRAHSK